MLPLPCMFEPGPPVMPLPLSLRKYLPTCLQPSLCQPYFRAAAAGVGQCWGVSKPARGVSDLPAYRCPQYLPCLAWLLNMTGYDWEPSLQV